MHISYGKKGSLKKRKREGFVWPLSTSTVVRKEKERPNWGTRENYRRFTRNLGWDVRGRGRKKERPGAFRRGQLYKREMRGVRVHVNGILCTREGKETRREDGRRQYMHVSMCVDISTDGGGEVVKGEKGHGCRMSIIKIWS